MMFGWSRAAFGVGLAIVGTISAAIGYLGFRLDERQPAGTTGSPTDAVASAPARVVAAVQTFFVPDPRKLFGKDDVRILLVGLDYDYDDKDQETSKQSRSDIIMAIDLNLRDHKVAELSIPRDMVATLPDGSRAKINSAQALGGIRESKAVVANWLGISGFDRYVVLRIDTAKDLVNAIGGVDLDVKNSNALRGSGPNGPIDYDDHWGHLAIHLKPGHQHLDGTNAVAYARFRHDWCSDPCRIMRQQQLIHAVVDKLERDKFNTLTHIQGLLTVVHNDVETDISPREQLSTAVAFAHLAPSDIVTAQVPYTSSIDLGEYGDSLVPDQDAKKKLVASFFGAPTDITASVAHAPAPVPGDIRIRVENGTHVPGLAARIATDLQKRGFVISDVADADSHDVAVTQIHGRNDSAPALEVVRKALGYRIPLGAALADAPATTAPGTVVVILGADIAATLGSAAP
jgi:LCP family protein required for cell wall assembly